MNTIKSKSSKRVLLCPLNWGLGHATRCIPIIDALQSLDYEVIVAGYGKSLNLLKVEYSNLKFIHFKGLEINYYNGIPAWASVLLQGFKVYKSIREEHEALKLITETVQPDIILSDNRYGVFSENIPSCLITHQLSPKAPFFQFFVSKQIARLINKFDTVLVPDYDQGNGLSGDLATNKYVTIPTKCLGLLSRFNFSVNKAESNIKLLALVSGPEPEQSDFVKKIYHSFVQLNDRTAIIHNSAFTFSNSENKVVEYKNISQKEMLQIIATSEIILCKAGYSTLMDLIVLNKKVVLLPTKGQTEQQYLVEYLNSFNIKCDQIIIDDKEVDVYDLSLFPNPSQQSLKETLNILFPAD